MARIEDLRIRGWGPYAKAQRASAKAFIERSYQREQDVLERDRDNWRDTCLIVMAQRDQARAERDALKN